MALVETGYQTLTLTFQDRDYNKGQIGFYVDNSVIIADILAAVDTIIVSRITALSDAVCIGWSISRGAIDNTPALAPEASDVERKGVFTFRGANNRPMSLQVPSIKNTLVIDRTNQINTADAAVAAFIGMMVDGTILGTVRPVTVTGADVTLFNSATKRHRASSKG